MRELLRTVVFASALCSCSGADDAREGDSLPESAKPERQEAMCPEGWLRYEPALVELVGQLQIVTRFGPPNFGESPDSDERLRVAVLILQAPISVCADWASDVNNEALVEVDSVQVVGSDNVSRLTSRSVVVEGRLSRAVTGRHFFPLVLHAVAVRGQ